MTCKFNSNSGELYIGQLSATIACACYLSLEVKQPQGLELNGGLGAQVTS